MFSVRELAVIELLMLSEGRVVDQATDRRSSLRLGGRVQQQRHQGLHLPAAQEAGSFGHRHPNGARHGLSHRKACAIHEPLLRRQLLRWLLIPLSLLLVTDAFVSYWIALEFAQRAYDRALVEIARDVALHLEGRGQRSS